MISKIWLFLKIKLYKRLAVKEMFKNYELVNHNGLNRKLEEEKNEAKKYINKLIVNMSQLE